MDVTNSESLCDIREWGGSYFRNCDETEPENIDPSKYDFINDIWIVIPIEQVLIKVSVLLPVVLWGLFGNVCLIYIIIRNRHLRSPTNYLIANMAFSDLILLIVQPWFFLGRDFFQNYQYGSIGCHFEGGFECTVLSASVINLVAISYDRLNSIALPQEKRLTVQNIKVIIFSVWIFGILFSTPLFIFKMYEERQWLNFLEQYCTEDVTISNIYWHIVIIIIVWIPLSTMLVCYVTLFIKLRHYEEVVLRKMKTLNVHYKKKVAKMMFVIIAVFVICRFPLTAFIFYRNHLLKKNKDAEVQSVKNQVVGPFYVLWFVSRYLILVNAALNPVIYGLTSEKFRRAFRKTAVSKLMFAFKDQNLAQIKKEQKQNKATCRNKKIFFIFRCSMQRNDSPVNETVTTNNGSN
ncbi:hypothetical protein FQR65_LT11542 [Abscondita terminalis]|nr:hypothetical protein FQR65_LT11542 [Abscondita terminalis]